jgi:asparagine synthase (glutamine-hydrolysing)
MHHRGPDDAGVWWSTDGRVGLAQRRLAIIDLSPGGHQPMANSSGEFWITYNGEIYNYQDLRRELEARGHQLRSASDTEVVLEAYRAWGIDCLSHFNGMFAFCIYDTNQDHLFMARDRAGEKPLFYYHSPDKFIVASELKAIMADPAVARELNLEALDFYLTYGYVPEDMCILNGVHKLPQGHAMLLDVETGSLRIWRYWALPEPSPRPYPSGAELSEELAVLLKDAVRRQLVADVPVGVLLSGGLDSSMVTAMAAQISSEPVRTFTITFPGHGSLDEGPFARMIADHFGTQHTELPAESATFELLSDLARQFDEPIADHAIIPTYLISKLIRQYAKVALSGDGGDELFGGYGHYAWILKIGRFKRLVPSVLRQAFKIFASEVLPVGMRGRNHLIGLAGDITNSIAHVNLYFDRRSRYRLYAPSIRNGLIHANPERYRANLCQSNPSLLRQAMEADFRTTLVDAYLVKVDRASMFTSLEVRAPFLDYRIIEFAYRHVPDCLKVTTKDRKILLRLLGGQLLPSTYNLKRKQGLTMPLVSWFKGKWGAYIEDVLQGADPHLFNKAMIDNLIQGQCKGYNNQNRLFSLTMFELWRRKYKVTLPS